MKILYVSNWIDGTGWSKAAQNYILALDAVGIDVVPQFIKLNQNIDKDVPQRIIELSKKSSDNADIVIQHCLPHFMEYNGHFTKNIGLSVFETSDFKMTDWDRHINLMDELWVPCLFNKNVCIDSNVTIPIEIVPHAFDITKYEKQYKPLNIPELKDKFVFYFIGELNRRKNIEALLKAFHTEFKPTEDVALCLKVNIPGHSPEQTSKIVSKIIEGVKSGLHLYKHIETYIPEVVLTGHLSDEEIMQLHSMCHCFVNPSYGESWSIPTFEAMAMGKTPICTKGLGMDHYINTEGYHQGGILVNSSDEIIFDAPCAVPDLNTAHSTWKSINIISLRLAMRSIYSNTLVRTNLMENGINNAYNFSLQNVGLQMKEILFK